MSGKSGFYALKSRIGRPHPFPNKQRIRRSTQTDSSAAPDPGCYGAGGRENPDGLLTDAVLLHYLPPGFTDVERNMGSPIADLFPIDGFQCGSHPHPLRCQEESRSYGSQATISVPGTAYSIATRIRPLPRAINTMESSEPKRLGVGASKAAASTTGVVPEATRWRALPSRPAPADTTPEPVPRNQERVIPLSKSSTSTEVKASFRLSVMPAHRVAALSVRCRIPARLAGIPALHVSQRTVRFPPASESPDGRTGP